MKELIKELKRDLRGLATAENKAVTYYIKTAKILLQLASIEAINKKEIITTITEVLSSKGLSESSIKKLRGGLMAYYEGAKKYPHKIDIISLRLDNIASRKEVEDLGRNYKKHGETEAPQNEGTGRPKSKKTIEVEKVDKSKYFSIVSSIIKIDEDTFYNLDDDKVIKLIEEVEKIAKILGKIKG